MMVESYESTNDNEGFGESAPVSPDPLIYDEILLEGSRQPHPKTDFAAGT